MIQVPYPDATGATNLYSLVFEESTNKVLNPISTLFVTYVEADRSTYKIALAELVAGCRFYVAAIPGETPAGTLTVVSYVQSGGSASGSDDVIDFKEHFP